MRRRDHSTDAPLATDADFAGQLNEEQQAAVSAPDGPVLVIAAAGTGKTRTLTYRVAWLVKRGVSAQNILLLTFTNRAAREMLDRAQRLVGEQVSGLWGGTFHHMANRVLRRHADRIGYKLDYTILDREDMVALIRERVSEIAGGAAHIPKPDVLAALFGLAASRQITVEELARERFGEHGKVPVSTVVKIHDAYVARKRELNAMDFDDLLVNALRLFREHPDLLEYYQNHFEHILVDEYQDTNSLQSDWVDLLAARRRNLFVVGDDFQSIYSWRGANYRNILDFPKRYPDARIYKLETNYRSVPGILEVANACIAGNPEQFQKTLRPIRRGDHRPQVLLVHNAQTQVAGVLQILDELLRSGYRRSDIAVLYRAHYHAMELQLELVRQGIPFVITSGTRFFEQAHVKDVCSLFRLWANPRDELAFLRLMGLLPRVGSRTAARIWTALGKHCDPGDTSSLKALRRLLPQDAQDDWNSIAQIFPKRAKAGAQTALNMADLIEKFLQKFYDEYLVETYENADRRREDLLALADYVAQFPGVEDFLNEMALVTNLDAEADVLQGAMENDSVRLSTVHQAKGLEWKVVILIWLVDGMFPSYRALEEEGEGEERRLFYVAVTRARDRLYLCVPMRRYSRGGGYLECAPSRFVTELPRDLLDGHIVYF